MVRNRFTVLAGIGGLGVALSLVALRGRSPAPFALEVPANHVSVGQQFRPRLVPSTSAGAAQTVTLTLRAAGGRTLSTQAVTLAGAPLQAPPLALPAPGAYWLSARAAGAAAAERIELQAAPEPASDLGGVLALDSLGLPAGAADYLRQHGFVVNPVPPGMPLPFARRVLVGDPGLGITSPAQLAAAYAALWSQVASGARALLLQPPPPALAPYWPVAPPLAPVRGCTADIADPTLAAGAGSPAGLDALLAPAVAFDLSHQAAFDLYHWNGTWLPRPNRRSGYPGCHALFSYRYGAGWVTVSTLPLLQHFQDLRARVYLMNLILALGRRKPAVPPSPGLAWVMRQRLRQLAAAPAAASHVALAPAELWYRPGPPPGQASVAPAEVPLPGLAGCWTSPGVQRAGASLRLQLAAPRPVSRLQLGFGSQAALWPAGDQLAASPDGRRWLPLAAPAPAAGTVTVALPARAGGWTAFRLRLTAAAPGHPWRVCAFSPEP